MQDYLELHRAYVQGLEDLARSLQQIEPAAAVDRTTSKALQRVLGKVPSPELESFIHGRDGRSPTPLPHLTERIQDELHVLGELCAQLGSRFEALDHLSQIWWSDAGVVQRLAAEPTRAALGPSCAGPAQGQQGAFLMAEVLDRCSRETELVKRVQATVSLESDIGTLGAQATILGLEPYLDAGALQIVASWLEADEGASDPPLATQGLDQDHAPASS